MTLLRRIETALFVALVFSLGALVTAPLSFAADDAPPAPRAAADPLAGARGHIARERWPEAIAALRRVNAPDSADWNNLMGFSLRKQARPDLDLSLIHI